MPSDPDSEQVHSPHSTASEEVRECRRRVLIADDEATIADTLRLILTFEGFEVRSVYGGLSAVETALAWRPDLFLTDVMMPDLDGIEAAIRIRQHYPACRILLLSGNAVVHDLLAAARKRGYDFETLLKPIHPTELIEHLRFTLAHR
jgi:CheY-like chemotaxis protein